MSGLHILGQRRRNPGAATSTAAVGAWFSGSDEAHAGIRAVRTLQAIYAAVAKVHPDVAKYEPQIAPIVAAADKWDKAIVFYTNDDAVELGRKAEAISQQISQEYNAGALVHDAALDRGAIEAVADTAKKAASFDFPWWGWALLAVGGAGLVAAFAVPPIVSAVAASRAARRFGR